MSEKAGDVSYRQKNPGKINSRLRIYKSENHLDFPIKRAEICGASVGLQQVH